MRLLLPPSPGILALPSRLPFARRTILQRGRAEWGYLQHGTGGPSGIATPLPVAQVRAADTVASPHHSVASYFFYFFLFLHLTGTHWRSPQRHKLLDCPRTPDQMATPLWYLLSRRLEKKLLHCLLVLQVTQHGAEFLTQRRKGPPRHVSEVPWPFRPGGSSNFLRARAAPYCLQARYETNWLRFRQLVFC